MPSPRFELLVRAGANSPATLTAPPRTALAGGPPPEFGGQDEWWTPEHLLLSAASLCLWTTFRAMAAKTRLRVQRYECRATVTADKTDDAWELAPIHLHVAMEVPAADVARAEELLHSAARWSLVSRGLKTPMVITATASASAA